MEDDELYRRFVDLSNQVGVGGCVCVMVCMGEAVPVHRSTFRPDQSSYNPTQTYQSQFLPAVAEDGEAACMDVSYAKTLAEMRNATFDGFKAARQWYYQTCNEFGYFQTSASPLSDAAQPFASFETITLDSVGRSSGLIDQGARPTPVYHIYRKQYLALCRELFHDVHAVPVQWTNTYYGEVRCAFPCRCVCRTHDTRWLIHKTYFTFTRSSTCPPRASSSPAARSTPGTRSASPTPRRSPIHSRAPPSF